jgi:hypothetical protein
VKRSGIMDRVLKSVALAMGVAAVVLTIWDLADPKTMITLLAVGLFALALAVF